MNGLYLTKTFPEREYRLTEYLLKLKEIDNMDACTFSERNSLDLKELQERTKVFTKVFNFTEYHVRNKIETKNIDDILLMYENKYNIDINLAICADRYISRLKKREKVNAILSIIIFFENINLTNYDFIIGEISSASDYICYKICKYLDVKYIFFWHGRVSGKIEFTNLEGKRIELQENYKNLLEKGLSEEEEKLFGEINEKYNNKEKPDYMKFAAKNTWKRVLNKEKKENILKRINKYARSYNIDKKYGADMPPYMLDKIKNYIIKIIFPIKYFILSKFFSESNTNEKYILVPLHYQPEASTSTFAPFFIDQIKHVENLSKSIPGGMKLYVKEHPSMMKDRKIKDYFRLRRIHNVKLISDKEDTIDLLKGSLGVATLTNTTGLEAIILDKPVFVFGNVFYQEYKYAYRCTNYYEFIKKLRESFEDWDSYSEDRYIHRKCFAVANYKSLRDGILTNIMFDRSYFNGSNLETISKSIIEIVNKKV